MAGVHGLNKTTCLVHREERLTSVMGLLPTCWRVPAPVVIVSSPVHFTDIRFSKQVCAKCKQLGDADQIPSGHQGGT